MRSMLRNKAILGALLCGAIAGGCSPSPAGPAPSPAAGPTNVDTATASERLTAEAAGLSPEDLVARGWDCRPVPGIPTRVTCSPPNQTHPLSLPGPPPAEDRPAALTVFVFENGAFVGTNLLIRSDLYQGQECRATRAPYRFIARIGYYECRHQSQAD